MDSDFKRLIFPLVLWAVLLLLIVIIVKFLEVFQERFDPKQIKFIDVFDILFMILFIFFCFLFLYYFFFTDFFDFFITSWLNPEVKEIVSNLEPQETLETKEIVSNLETQETLETKEKDPSLGKWSYKIITVPSYWSYNIIIVFYSDVPVFLWIYF